MASSQQDMDGIVADTRARVAFFGSTPAYRGVRAVHGLDDLHRCLRGLSRQGRGREMTALIDDEVLGIFSIVGSPAEVARRVMERFAGVAQRIVVDPPTIDPDHWHELLGQLQRA